jgi:prepilin-type processing-associated H-X9-DG protein
MTNYMAVVGDETLWPNSSGRKVDEISDGLSNTIAVVEMKGLEIPWTKPFDLEFTKMSFQINSGSTSDIASRHGGGANLLMADGSVRYIQQIDPNLLRGFLTVAGGEDTSPP